MSRDYEPITSTPTRQGGIRNVLIMVALAFVGGMIAFGWAASKFELFGADQTSETVVAEENTAAPTQAAADLAQRIRADGTVEPATPAPSAATASTEIEPITERALARRVAELEDRLSRINVQAQAASGNAARAEGLLIAFAARRALDRGTELGYIEEQLKLRFGAAQPVAVTTIINAAKTPVTLDQLRSQLEDIGPGLTTGSSNDGFWTDLRKELSELFVVRKEGTPSPAPAQRLARAQRFLETGRVESALAEVKRLPGKEDGQAWMTLAQRYIDARDALDLIETAAILEPRELRTSEGTPVEQTSPLAPQTTPER